MRKWIWTEAIKEYGSVDEQQHQVFFEAFPNSFCSLFSSSCRCFSFTLHIRVTENQAAALLSFFSALNTPSPPCSSIRESFPRALTAKQITVWGSSMWPLRVAVSVPGSDDTDTLISWGGTVPFTLQVTAGLGLESTEQRHKTSESSSTHEEENGRMSGLSAGERERERERERGHIQTLPETL